jgi:hypothetical protein
MSRAEGVPGFRLYEPRSFMNDERQSESASPVPARNQVSANASPAHSSRLIAKLRFFRTMLWVIVYALSGVFLMSVILLDGLRAQSKIIGGALLLALVLIAVTYGLQWYS